MTLRAHTARVAYAGPDRLDITAKSADPAGRAFAPSWAILGPALELRRTGGPVAMAYAWPEYAAAYTSEMRASYKRDRAAWDALLALDRVVLVCYCTDAAHCHRRVLAEILARLGAVDAGEIEHEPPRQIGLGL